MRRFATAYLLSTFGVTVLLGQTPSPPPQTQPGSGPGGAARAVTGCLRSGAQAGTFVLANAKWDSTPRKDPAEGDPDATPPKDRPTSPTTETGARQALPEGETLRLASLDTRLDLSEHVGHTVTVTGTLAREDRVVTPGVVLPDTPRPGDTTSRTPQVTGKPPARVLNVRSLTHVAATCQ
ncbi:MAG: hypothetical protein ACRD15_11735 [Vicinamibacterales bacterium]